MLLVRRFYDVSIHFVAFPRSTPIGQFRKCVEHFMKKCTTHNVSVFPALDYWCFRSPTIQHPAWVTHFSYFFRFAEAAYAAFDRKGDFGSFRHLRAKFRERQTGPESCAPASEDFFRRSSHVSLVLHGLSAKHFFDRDICLEQLRTK